LTDKDNGQYHIKYKMDQDVENLKIHIFFKDQNEKFVEIRGSPFSAWHKVGVSPKNNEINGPSML